MMIHPFLRFSLFSFFHPSLFSCPLHLSFSFIPHPPSLIMWPISVLVTFLSYIELIQLSMLGMSFASSTFKKDFGFLGGINGFVWEYMEILAPWIIIDYCGRNCFGNEFKMESFLILSRMILMLNRMISFMLRITKMVDDIIFMDVYDDAKNAFVDADMDGEISMEKGCSLPHSWKLGTVSSSITWKQNFKSNVINLLLKSVCSPFCQILSLVAWFSPTTTSKFVVLQILRYREMQRNILLSEHFELQQTSEQQYCAIN